MLSIYLHCWKVVYNDDKIMDIIICIIVGRILVGVIRESQIILFCYNTQIKNNNFI